jgi:threonine/homoserine/homoserine lactone efflux protein
MDFFWFFRKFVFFFPPSWANLFFFCMVCELEHLGRIHKTFESSPIDRPMGFWEVFVITFVLGLGGAMSPGALLTYTIFKSLAAKEKGYLVGFFVSLGHALIEITLILILIGGLGTLIAQPVVITIIGILGGSLLCFFGSQILLDIKRNRIDLRFLEKNPANSPSEGFNSANIAEGETDETSKSIDGNTPLTFDSNTPPATDRKSRLYDRHPIFGSMLFLASNPYWWLWWATAGLSIILDYNVNFENPSVLWGLLIGKELGVFLWYTFIGAILGASSHLFNKRVYLAILLVCGLFMSGYGIYLFLSPLLTFF